MNAKFTPYHVIFPQTTRSGTAISMDIQREYCLELRIHQATGLRKADWIGRNDVYIQVYRPEYAKTEIIQGKKMLLPGPQKRLSIEGEVTAPFAFSLPQDKGPSVEIGVGDGSYIRYKVRAYIDMVNWRDPFSRRLITVIAHRPIPKPLLLKPHINEVGSQSLASCCFSIGKYGMAAINIVSPMRQEKLLI